MSRRVAFASVAVVIIGLAAYAWSQRRGHTAEVAAVTLWDEEQPDIQRALDEVLKGHGVQRSHYKTEDLRTQFQMAAMAGRGPDLLLAPNDFAGVLAAMGLLEPVEGWARMERFVPLARQAITDASGASYGLPLNHGNHLVLFVNRRLRPEPPASLEEMARPTAFNAPEEGRFDLAFQVLEPFWFVPFLGAFGERALLSRRPNLATEATVRALAYVHGLEFATKVMPADCDYACAEELFLARKAAMTINGDWAIGRYAAELGSDLAILPLPRSEATGLAAEPMISGKYLMVRKGLPPERLSRAKELALYLTSEDVQQQLALRTKRLPSLAGMTLDDPLLAASQRAAANARPMPMEVEMRAVWDAIRPQLQEVMAGRQTPEAAAPLMQADAEKRIEAIGH